MVFGGNAAYCSTRKPIADGANGSRVQEGLKEIFACQCTVLNCTRQAEIRIGTVPTDRFLLSLFYSSGGPSRVAIFFVNCGNGTGTKCADSARISVHVRAAFCQSVPNQH